MITMYEGATIANQEETDEDMVDEISQHLQVNSKRRLVIVTTFV